jgi:plastocyanin
MSERKRITFTAIAVALVGIVTGLLLGGGLLPSQAAYQIYDERVTTETTGTILEHTHDDIPEHTHTIITEITTTETTPHGYFHGLAPTATAPTTAPDTTATGTAPTTAPTTAPDTTAAAPTPTTAQGVSEILMYDMLYLPISIVVPAGTTVTWTQMLWGDGHSLVIDDLFGEQVLWQGDSFSYTFTEPGTYEYYCSFHEEGGTVIVE